MIYVRRTWRDVIPIPGTSINQASTSPSRIRGLVWPIVCIAGRVAISDASVPAAFPLDSRAEKNIQLCDNVGSCHPDFAELPITHDPGNPVVYNADRMKRQIHLLIILVSLSQAACAGRGPIDDRAAMVREVSDSRFDSYLRERVKDEHFTGAALIMREGKIVHAKGYGSASGSRANTVDTKFHVGSITKQFTAAAIMQLVEKGVVKLDGPINSYLPSKYRSPKWAAVTVHHLLSHTSGITDYAVARDYYHVVRGFCSEGTVEAMVKEAMGKDLQFVPGSKYSYTNLGYTLLGSVIENQTNTSYDEYIQNSILNRMGMSSSGMHRFGRVPTEAEAHGNRWSEERKMHVADELVSLPATAPDGGLVTTLGDFVKWARLYTAADATLLSQDSIRLMSSPAIQIGAGGPLDSMGYGLYVGDRLIGHGGLIVGFSSQFIYDRESRSLIVVFSNDASDNPQQIVFGLLTILLTPQA